MIENRYGIEYTKLVRFLRSGGSNIKMGGVQENDLGHCRSQTRLLEDVQDVNSILNQCSLNMALNNRTGVINLQSLESNGCPPKISKSTKSSTHSDVYITSLMMHSSQRTDTFQP